ncbi:MAG: hypothetical protein ABI435_04120 [Pseudolysinimonas sp.]
MVDSSTIGALGHELAAQLYDLKRLDARPTISSFGGYEGLANETSSSTPDARSLVLISYSATGRLGARVLERSRIDDARSVVTVFADRNSDLLPGAGCFLASEVGIGIVVDTASESEDPTITGCRRCDAGQSLIVVSGEQLLPLSPRTRVAEIKPRNSPAGLKEDMRDLIHFETIRVNVRGRQPGVGAYTREIYLNLDDLAEDLAVTSKPDEGSILKGIRGRLAEASTVSTAWIIHMEDRPSIQMAKVVLEGSRSSGATATDANVLAVSDLTRPKGNLPELGPGTVVVVAGAIASGRDLELLSEVLRTAHPQGPIHYVILFSRSESDATWRKFSSNLTFASGANKNRLTEPQHIELPPDRKHSRTIWEREIEFWQTWVTDVADDRSIEVSDVHRRLAADRIFQIQHLNKRTLSRPGVYFEPESGLRDCLFLPGLGSGAYAADPSSEHHLRLQPKFSFWAFDYQRLGLVPRQADVYATISAALNWMRQPDGDRAPVFDQYHNRTVIDPSDFGRYTDGVVQSAILRSAGAAELDYRGDPDLSAAMVAVLERLARKPPSKGGNALPEFLLAMAMGRLRIHPVHLESTLEMLERHIPLASVEIGLLLDIVRARSGDFAKVG